jgi:DNA-binding transcriptional ArsR family regulator
VVQEDSVGEQGLDDNTIERRRIPGLLDYLDLPIKVHRHSTTPFAARERHAQTSIVLEPQIPRSKKCALHIPIWECIVGPMPRAATTSDSFNAIAEPRRREILNYLALQKRPVGDIVDRLGLAQPSVSKHLRVLREVGLVHVRREGRQMFYRTNAEGIRPLHEWVRHV